MKRLAVIVSAVLSAMTASYGARTSPTVPEFWYVVPATDSPNEVDDVVRGIVVPASVAPSIKNSPQGSIISWRRLDGTTHSFVVQGVSSLAFERGPLAGTIYIPFRAKRLMEADSGCCDCITFEDMSDSVEFLACEPGCPGCTCGACICPEPCPSSPAQGLRLKANNGVGPSVMIGRRGTAQEIGFENHGAIAARFSGSRVLAGIDSRGVTTIENPDSITLSDGFSSRTSIVGDKAHFAWSSPDASIILEQPVTMAAPVVGARTIELHPGSVDRTVLGRYREVQPRVRCSVCGTYPNHYGDNERMVCLPGTTGTCYRCVSWDC